MGAKLQVTNLSSKEVVLEKFLPPDLDIVTIGRHPSSYVYLTSAHVSKEHALIIHENDIFFLVDKSSNGTLLNQNRVERDKRIKLKNGDLIVAGEYQILVIIEQEQAVVVQPAKVTAPKVATPNVVSASPTIPPGGGVPSANVRPIETVKKEPLKEALKEPLKDPLTDEDEVANAFASMPTSFQDVIRGLDPGEESSYLVMVGGKKDGQRVELRGSTSEVYVGRSPNCQVQIDHSSISPTHAKIRMDWAGISVYDLNSQTGVFINGVRIAGSRKLHNGDEISFGIPTNVGGVKLILYDRNSISGDNWIGVPPPITIKNNDKVIDKVDNKDKGKAEQKQETATPPANAAGKAETPAIVEKATEKTEDKINQNAENPEDKVANVKALLDMNRVIYAGLTVRDILFISILFLFVVGFIVIGLSFL